MLSFWYRFYGISCLKPLPPWLFHRDRLYLNCEPNIPFHHSVAGVGILIIAAEKKLRLCVSSDTLLSAGCVHTSSPGISLVLAWNTTPGSRSTCSWGEVESLKSNALSWMTGFCSDHFQIIRNVTYPWFRMIAQEQKIFAPPGILLGCWKILCIRFWLHPPTKRSETRLDAGEGVRLPAYLCPSPTEENPARTAVKGNEEVCPQSGWPNWLLTGEWEVSSHSNPAPFSGHYEKQSFRPSMVAHVCTPSTQEADSRKLPWVLVQCGLCGEF